jgi:hypothetical protein
MRLLVRLVLLFLALQAWQPSFAATPTPPKVTLTGEKVAHPWLEVTPFAPAQRDKLFQIPDGATTVSLEGLAMGPALLCIGAQERATRCEKVILEEGVTLRVAAPAAGVQVKGRILTGRRPAAGTKVAVLPDPLPMRRLYSMPLFHDGKRLVPFVECDAEGRFTLPRLSPGDYRFDLRLSGGRLDQAGPFTVPDPKKLRPASQAGKAGRAAPAPAGPPVLDLGDLVLEEGILVDVLVTDAQGKPVPGADIGAMQGGPEEQRQGKVVFYQSRTDEAGMAHLSGVQSDRPLQVSCQARGYRRSELPFDAPPPLVRCALERFSGFEGTVVDEDDKPVSGATVAVRLSDLSARTREDGTFSIDQLQPGDFTFTVGAPGFRAARREGALAPEERRKLGPIRLEKAGALSGTVVDGITEEPVSGATLSVLDPAGAGSTVTGVDGTFQLRAGSPEPLRLEVAATGYPAATVEVPVEKQESAEPLRIELRPGGRIHVMMWNEEEGIPCAGCTVGLTAPGGKGAILTMGSQGDILTEPLAPGAYNLSREHVQSFGGQVLVQGGDDQRFVAIEPGKTVEVSFGEKRSTLEVVFSPPPPPGWRLSADSNTAMKAFDSQSEGVFRIHRKPGEEVELSLGVLGELRLRVATLPPDFSEPDLQISLPATLIRGFLLRGEGPASAVRVELVSAATGNPVGWVVTRADGSFEAPFLPPGPYRLIAGRQTVASIQVRPEGMTEAGALSLPEEEVRP